jgi:NhaP-type Na+/H+ or K+/H+ antiporter
MDTLDYFTPEIEQIFVAFIFILFGIYLNGSVEKLLDLRILTTAVIVLLIIRPVSGWITLYKTDLSSF